MNLFAGDQDIIHAPDRIAVLGTIDLGNASMRAEIDAVAMRTARATSMPTSMASVVLGMAQVVSGSYGLTGLLAEVGGSPIDWAFCRQVVMTGQPYIVSDAAVDPVQSTNPLVTMDGLRSYAGVPIVVSGQTVGAICVLGDMPRHFTDLDIVTLRQAAMEIGAIMRRWRDPAGCVPGPSAAS